MAKKLEEKAADRNDTPAERNPRTQDGGRKRRCNRDFVVLCCCRWNDHWHLLVLSVVLSVYLCAGAGIFVQLEGPAEHARIRDAITNRTRLIEARAHIVGNITATGSLTEQEALELVFMIGNISAADATLDFSRNWEYGPAIFFATTVITTIGYGSIAPVTLPGRLFCIFYALGGIPVALVFLSTMGNIFNTWLDLIIKCFGNRVDKRILKAIALTASILVGLCLFIFIPSFAFMALEPWDYVESVYFSFVTLTTIGFGDYVTSQSAGSLESSDALHGFYRVCTAVWIWFGLAFVSLLISRMQSTAGSVGKGLQKCWITIREKRKVTQGVTEDVNGGKKEIEMDITVNDIETYEY